MNGKKKRQNTPFECSGQILYNWSENEWTKRLVTGLQKLLPNHNVTYTAEWGTQWDKYLLTRLGVIKSYSANYFLFRGSPDIVIGNKHLANHGISGSTANDSSSEDELIENSHQRPPMQGASIHELPEKVGEVFGGLHLLMICLQIMLKLMTQHTLFVHFLTYSVPLRECGLDCVTITIKLSTGLCFVFY